MNDAPRWKGPYIGCSRHADEYLDKHGGRWRVIVVRKTECVQCIEAGDV